MTDATLTGFVVAGVAAMAYWLAFATDQRNTALRSGVKTACVAVLALTAWQAGALWPVTLGLAAGALGDFALSRQGQSWFLAGMGVFAVGHLAYAGAFVAVALGGSGLQVPVLPLIALAVLLVSTEVWLAPRTGPLRWPVRGYVVVIGAMAAAALLIAPGTVHAGTGRAVLLAGVLCFVLSDLILAVRLFVPAAPAVRRLADLTLWPLYAAGQGMILWGMLSLQAAAGGPVP